MSARPDIVRILLVDDHKVLRDGLRALLELETDLRVVGEAGTGAAAMDERVDVAGLAARLGYS